MITEAEFAEWWDGRTVDGDDREFFDRLLGFSRHGFLKLVEWMAERPADDGPDQLRDKTTEDAMLRHIAERERFSAMPDDVVDETAWLRARAPAVNALTPLMDSVRGLWDRARDKPGDDWTQYGAAPADGFREAVSEGHLLPLVEKLNETLGEMVDAGDASSEDEFASARDALLDARNPVFVNIAGAYGRAPGTTIGAALRRLGSVPDPDDAAALLRRVASTPAASGSGEVGEERLTEIDGGLVFLRKTEPFPDHLDNAVHSELARASKDFFRAGFNRIPLTEDWPDARDSLTFPAGASPLNANRSYFRERDSRKPWIRVLDKVMRNSGVLAKATFQVDVQNDGAEFVLRPGAADPMLLSFVDADGGRITREGSATPRWRVLRVVSDRRRFELSVRDHLDDPDTDVGDDRHLNDVLRERGSVIFFHKDQHVRMEFTDLTYDGQWHWNLFDASGYSFWTDNFPSGSNLTVAAYLVDGDMVDVDTLFDPWRRSLRGPRMAATTASEPASGVLDIGRREVIVNNAENADWRAVGEEGYRQALNNGFNAKELPLLKTGSVVGSATTSTSVDGRMMFERLRPVDALLKDGDDGDNDWTERVGKLPRGSLIPADASASLTRDLSQSATATFAVHSRPRHSGFFRATGSRRRSDEGRKSDALVLDGVSNNVTAFHRAEIHRTEQGVSLGPLAGLFSGTGSVAEAVVLTLEDLSFQHDVDSNVYTWIADRADWRFGIDRITMYAGPSSVQIRLTTAGTDALIPAHGDLVLAMRKPNGEISLGGTSTSTASPYEVGNGGPFRDFWGARGWNYYDPAVYDIAFCKSSLLGTADATWTCSGPLAGGSFPGVSVSRDGIVIVNKRADQRYFWQVNAGRSGNLAWWRSNPDALALVARFQHSGMDLLVSSMPASGFANLGVSTSRLAWNDRNFAKWMMDPATTDVELALVGADAVFTGNVSLRGVPLMRVLPDGTVTPAEDLGQAALFALGDESRRLLAKTNKTSGDHAMLSWMWRDLRGVFSGDWIEETAKLGGDATERLGDLALEVWRTHGARLD